MRAGREASRRSVLFRHAVAERFGIGASDAECLDYLVEHGAATAGDLARLTDLTTGAITSVIRRLERAGLVSSRRDPADRRRLIVKPVRARTARARAIYGGFVGRGLQRLTGYSNAEIAVVTDYLMKMSELYAAETLRLSKRALPTGRKRRVAGTRLPRRGDTKDNEPTGDEPTGSRSSVRAPA
jgi:DNA-binding MarR family transcriptional regulator